MTPQAAVEVFPKMYKMGEDGVLELYLDNHSLSAWRICPGYFEEMFEAYPGQNLALTGRNWGIEFGTFFHKGMEYFYKAQRDDWEGHFGLVKQDIISFLQIISDEWKKHDLDYFMAPELKKGLGKNAQALGGHDGALRLFTQYYKQYWRQERFRFVGSELTFGYNREFLIGEIPGIVRFYYCGRIDQIVDDTNTIGPMDFKTTSYFNGNERDMFKPDDGMQGYVAFVREWLRTQHPELEAEGRLCNTMIIRHVSVRDAPIEERFKSSYIQYTPSEMYMWHSRQLKTFKEIYEHMILGEAITWNTRACNSGFYFQPCPYKALHGAAPAEREGIIKTFYQIQPAWSHDRDGNGN